MCAKSQMPGFKPFRGIKAYDWLGIIQVIDSAVNKRGLNNAKP